MEQLLSFETHDRAIHVCKLKKSLVARISSCYRGRNDSLPSIGWKGRFLCGEMQERKTKMKLDKKKSKDGEPLCKQWLGFCFQ